MKPAALFRTLSVLLLAATTGFAVAKPDAGATGPTPVPYTHAVHFSKFYNPDLKPDHMAFVLAPAPLDYPKKWRQWGQPAYAVVEFLIADTGFPREVQCSEATDSAFAKAAVKTIEQSIFCPAIKNQQGVYSKMVHRMEFKVEPPKAEPAAQPAAPAASKAPAAPAAK